MYVIDWLVAVPGDKHKAKCRYCEIEMLAQISALKKHTTSTKHRGIMKVG